jgi:hypothetical protein
VQYFALLASGMTLSTDRVSPSRVYLEACESYRKQSYRNRCYILSPGGVEMLQVPVVHDGARLITDIRVDYSTPWVEKTFRTLDTAYYTSAFYEYYRDELLALFEARPATLWELNSSLTGYLLGRCGIAAELIPTTDFAPPTTEAPATFKADDDWRERIDPKKPDTVLHDLGLDRHYYQLFSSRCGFIPGLSVVDLLFNEGPDSISWLRA